MVKRLEKIYRDEIADLLLEGCLLEDHVSLIFEQLDRKIKEMKEGALKILKEYQVSEQIPSGKEKPLLTFPLRRSRRNREMLLVPRARRQALESEKTGIEF